jgi:hypothetical protein
MCKFEYQCTVAVEYFICYYILFLFTQNINKSACEARGRHYITL